MVVRCFYSFYRLFLFGTTPRVSKYFTQLGLEHELDLPLTTLQTLHKHSGDRTCCNDRRIGRVLLVTMPPEVLPLRAQPYAITTLDISDNQETANVVTGLSTAPFYNQQSRCSSRHFLAPL